MERGRLRCEPGSLHEICLLWEIAYFYHISTLEARSKPLSQAQLLLTLLKGNHPSARALLLLSHLRM